MDETVAVSAMILQLELCWSLCWMGVPGLRAAEGAGGSVELPVKRPADCSSSEVASYGEDEEQIDNMLEYLELVAPTEISDSDTDVSDQEATASSSNPEAAHAMSMLKKKEIECEHLRQIIKELVQSRAHVARTSAEVQHRYCALQAEFCRARKVTDLARTVSQQHIGRLARMRKELQETQLRAYRAEQQVAALGQANADLQLDVAEHRHKVAVLEKLHTWDAPGHASCFQQFPYVRQVALY